jgi:hypothetical protein
MRHHKLPPSFEPKPYDIVGQLQFIVIKNQEGMIWKGWSSDYYTALQAASEAVFYTPLNKRPEWWSE